MIEPIRKFRAGLLALALFAQPAGAMSPSLQLMLSDGRYPAKYIGLVTDHQGLPNSTTSSAVFVNFRSAQVLLQPITTNRIKIAIWNAYGAIGSATGEETAPGVVTDVEGAFEIGGNCYQATFLGSKDGTIAAPGVAISDWISVPNAQAGTPVAIRGFVHAPSGYVFYAVTGESSRDTGNFSSSSQASLASGSGNSCPTITNNASNAQFITAGAYTDTIAPSIFVLGDSREASFENARVQNLNLGDIQGNILGQKANVAILNPSIPSRRASQFLANNPGEVALLPYFSDIVSELGFNDMNSGGNTAAQTETSLEGIFSTLQPTQHVIQSKIFFETTDTVDGYTTLGGQSMFSSTSKLTSFNSDLASGIVTGVNNGYIDPLAVIQPTGVYRLGPNARSPNDCTMNSGSNVLTSPSANFTSADIGFNNSISGVGNSSGVANGNEIGAVSSATHVTLLSAAATFSQVSANAGTTQTSGQSCNVAAAIVWNDGIHLTTGGVGLLINAGSGYIPLSRFHYP